jgi:hypothetical protein
MLQNLDIINNGSIDGWIPSDGIGGELQWHRDGSPVIVFATPHWDTDGVVPVDYIDADDDYRNLPSFTIDINESVENQLKEYLSKLKPILSNF